MTRLIDADALPVQELRNALGGIGYAVTKADIDAAPTIACERCEHYDAFAPDRFHNPYKWGACKQSVGVGDDAVREDFGCVHFSEATDG